MIFVAVREQYFYAVYFDDLLVVERICVAIAFYAVESLVAE